MSREHREEAIEAIYRDGLVVLNGVVDTSHLDLLGAKMEEDVGPNGAGSAALPVRGKAYTAGSALYSSPTFSAIFCTTTWSWR